MMRCLMPWAATLIVALGDGAEHLQQHRLEHSNDCCECHSSSTKCNARITI